MSYIMNISVGDRKNISILGITILSILIIGSLYGIQESSASHLVTTIDTVGPTVGVKFTEFALGDAGGVFASCSFPNDSAGNARLRIVATSSLTNPLADVNPIVVPTISPPDSVVSTTFDITNTGTFGVDEYLVACTYQEGSPPNDDHNFVSTHLFNIVAPPAGGASNFLTLEKSVLNDDGGINVPDAWELFADADPPNNGLNFSNLGGSGTSTGIFDSVEYTLSETGPVGYSSTGIWSCVGSGTFTFTSPDTIELVGGATVTCTITNDDIQPTLTLV